MCPQADEGLNPHGVWGSGSGNKDNLIAGLAAPHWGALLAGVPGALCPKLKEGRPMAAADTVRAYSQEPVHRDDERDVVGGQAHRGQHDDHGDQTCLRDPSCPDAGSRGCDAVKRSSQTETICTNLPQCPANTQRNV